VTGGATYYEASAPPLDAFPPLAGDRRTDVCVIGAGFTGLGAALALREKGLSVVVVEQDRVASGASGRNGGQIHTGLRRDQIHLEKKFGLPEARALWEIGQAAVAQMDTWMARHGIDCDRREGLIYADHRGRFVDDTHRYVDHLRTHYSYDKVDKLDQNQILELVRSGDYEGGMVDRGGGHLHPLKYARGLARAAAAAGADIFEQTKALNIEPGSPARVVTREGTVTADWVLVAGDSMMKGILPEADVRFLPIAWTIGVTVPLGDRLREYLNTPMAVADSRFVVNYFRPTPDGRLLFGGGESYSTTYVSDPARLVRKALTTVFPPLADTRFDYAWSGVVGITPTRLPLVRRVQPNVLVAAGYSGQGVALAPFAGSVLAEAVAGTLGRFDVLARLPVPAFPGGPALRHPLLVLAMLWYALRDRL
jgi:gamma-glutamylputrescine oxidase